jgi:D-alanine transaminase
MNSYAYYNGSFGKKDEISIPLQDRSIYFGDAIYDAAIGSYDRIMWEDEHINRFLLNAKRLGITHSYTRSFLSSLLREIGIKSMLSSYFIYFQMSRSLPNRIHSAKDAKANLLITVDQITIEQSPSSLSLITLPDKRYGYCHIKTVNLIPSVLASTKAEEQGADEAIFVRGRYVTECAKSNISIIKEGRMITHPANNRILPGITRAHLLSNCEQLGIPYEERPFTVGEMLSADEIVVTSTTKLCRTVGQINNLPVGGKNSHLAEKLSRKMYLQYKNLCINEPKN